jgi:hypothetical protein
MMSSKPKDLRRNRACTKDVLKITKSSLIFPSAGISGIKRGNLVYHTTQCVLQVGISVSITFNNSIVT